MIARNAVFEVGDAILPIARDSERPIFSEAWEAQAFAMVVALHEAGLFAWPEWTAALSRQIAAVPRSSDHDPDDSYYRHWLAALENLVVEKGAASRAALLSCKAAWGRGSGDAARAADPARKRSASPGQRESEGRPVKAADRKAHWERVYATKAETEVSWFQEDPKPSLEALARIGAGPSAGIVDVGGGASRLVDRLVQEGFGDVSVLDVSAAALEAAKARLGEAAGKVRWIVADATDWTPQRSFDVWHDRAAFHFLVDPDDQASYLERLRGALRPGGFAIIATFAPDGPEKCSGLAVARYDGQSLGEALGPDFALVESRRYDHRTPSGAVQRFQFSTFRRV